MADDVFFDESEAENLPFVDIGALYEQYKVSEE